VHGEERLTTVAEAPVTAVHNERWIPSGPWQGAAPQQFVRLTLVASAEKESLGSPDGVRSLATVTREAEAFPEVTE